MIHIFGMQMLIESDTDEESLSCVLTGTCLTTGQWVRVPDPLDPVDCIIVIMILFAVLMSLHQMLIYISLYLAQGLPEAQEGFYKCCLPTDFFLLLTLYHC